MEVNILNESKDALEVEISSLTMVELLRVYLNDDSSVSFVAWKREHPTHSPILSIKTKGKSPKKALNDAIGLVIKELDLFEKDFFKLK